MSPLPPPHTLRAAKCRTLRWHRAKERLPEGGRTDTNVSQFKGRKIAWFRASFLNEIYLWLHPTPSNCSQLPYLRQSEASTCANCISKCSLNYCQSALAFLSYLTIKNSELKLGLLFESNMILYFTPRKITGCATGWKVRGSNRGRGRRFLSSPNQTGSRARQHVLRIRSWG